MSENESPARDGAIERPGSLSSPNSSPQNTRRRLELGERAGKYLDGMCDAIASGRVDLWQLPLPIASIYLLGYEQGRASQHERIENFAFLLEAYRWDTETPRRKVGDWIRTRLIEAERELWRESVAP